MIGLADSYAQMLAGWTGALVVELAGGAEHRVEPGEVLTLCELGALASWPGTERPGHFWPWASVAGIHQVMPSAEPAGPEAAREPAQDS